MMKKVKLILAALLFVTAINVQAQNAENPWSIGIGINTVDIRTSDDFGDFMKDWGGASDINILPAISRLTVGRYLSYGLTGEMAGSFNKVNKGFDWQDGDKDLNRSFWSLDARLKYDLRTLFNKKDGWFEPYLQAGVGFSHYGSNNDFKVLGGLGFRTWLSEHWGLNFQTAYAHAFNDDATDYFQHSIGVVVRFGKPKASAEITE